MAFSDLGLPTIDGQAVTRLASPMILRNAVQGYQQVNGYGVNEEFATITEGVTEIRVNRIKPIQAEVRGLGATTNGGFFTTASAEVSQTQSYGLRFTYVYDAPFDVPQLLEDSFSPSVLDGVVYNMAQFLSKQVNASTMAEQIVKAINFARTQTAGEANKTNVVELDPALVDGSVLNSLEDGYAVLDDGDETNGIDTFDYDGRCVLVRSKVKRALPKGVNGTLSIGNFQAQKMLKVGGADPDTDPNNVADGLFGIIDSTPHYMTSAPIWKEVEKYIVTSAGAVLAPGTLDIIEGMITHAKGTSRGLGFSRGIKIIDHPTNQGKRLQPLYRWAIETFFPKSVVLLGDATALATFIDTTLVGDLAILQPGSQV